MTRKYCLWVIFIFLIIANGVNCDGQLVILINTTKDGPANTKGSTHHGVTPFCTLITPLTDRQQNYCRRDNSW